MFSVRVIHCMHRSKPRIYTRVAPGTCYDRAAIAAQLKPWGRMTEPTSNSAPTSLVARDHYVGLEIAVLSSLPHHSKRNVYSAVLLYLLYTSLNMNKIKQVRLEVRDPFVLRPRSWRTSDLWFENPPAQY